MTEKQPLGSTPPTPAHADVLARLADDHIGWFTTVRADGSPHAVPVWFLWHAGRLLVMSEPRTAKVTNVRRGSPALLHLHTRADGNGVVVLSGPAVISDRTAPQWLPEIGEAYTRQVRRGDGGLRHGAGGRSPRSSTSSSSSCPPTCRRGEASRTRGRPSFQ